LMAARPNMLIHSQDQLLPLLNESRLLPES
jgi:hypothetical protein